MQLQLRSISIIGAFFYSTTLILSICFYLERTAFLDISFHLFYILKDNGFAIQNFRFVAFITQLFPLIGSKLGADLKTLMILYSISFVLLNVIIFYVLVRVLKEWKLGLTLLFLNSIVVTHTFYWIQSEYQQGLPLLILYFGIAYYVSQMKLSKSKTILMYLLGFMSFIVAFSHPLIILPATFMVIYFSIHDWKNKSKYIYPYLSFITFYLTKHFLFKTVYDTKSMDGIDNIIAYFPNYLALESNKHFLKYVYTDYYFVVIIMIVLLIVYLKDKRYLKGIFIVSYVIAHILLINICYPNGADQFYIENMYLPLGLYLGLAFSYDVIERIDIRYVMPLLGLFILLRLGNIYWRHQPYTNRVEFLESVLEHNDIVKKKKNIIKTNDSIKSILIMDWATPYELWLLSTIKNKPTASIIITNNVNEIEWALPYNNRFITKWGAFEYSEFSNNKYFIFKDTSYYEIIEGDSLKLY